MRFLRFYKEKIDKKSSINLMIFQYNKAAYLNVAHSNSIFIGRYVIIHMTYMRKDN